MILSPEERLHWYGFTAGWKEWKHLKDCNELVSFAKMSRSTIKYKLPTNLPSAGNMAAHLGTEDGGRGEEAKVETTATGTEDLTGNQLSTWAGLQLMNVEDEEGDSECVIPSKESVTKTLKNAISSEAPKGLLIEEIGAVDLSSDVNISLNGEDCDELTSTPYKDDVREMAKREQMDPQLAEVKTQEEINEHMRRHKRYDLRYHVSLILENKKFSSFTVDISLGGLSLKDNIPDWVAGYFTVIISTLDLKKQLEFMGSVVENQSNQRHRLEIYPSSDSDKLKKWLKRDEEKKSGVQSKKVS